MTGHDWKPPPHDCQTNHLGALRAFVVNVGAWYHSTTVALPETQEAAAVRFPRLPNTAVAPIHLTDRATHRGLPSNAITSRRHPFVRFTDRGLALYVRGGCRKYGLNNLLCRLTTLARVFRYESGTLVHFRAPDF